MTPADGARPDPESPAEAGLTLGGLDTPLTQRAAALLQAGPVDSQTLIAQVCHLPAVPPAIAEHMAAALIAGHHRFARDGNGRWRLRDAAAPGWPAAPAAAGLPLERESFIVVDVETTGARAYGGDRVTEAAAVLVRGGEATVVFDTLINPERPIPQAVTAITNITSEMVRRAPRFPDVCDQLLGVLEGRVFVAHNARFDWRFLSMEVERATRRALLGRSLCTVRMARAFVPELRRRNLDALANHYGIENPARHRAGGDALATARALLRMLDAARDGGCVTLADVHARLARGTSARRRRRRRPSALPGPARDDATA